MATGTALKNQGMKAQVRRLNRWAAPRALKALQAWLSRKTEAKVEAWGEKMGRTLARMSKRRVQVAIDNLGIAFPEKSLEERRKIALASFEHFGRATADFLTAHKRSPEQVQKATEIRGREHFEAAVAQGKGVLLITGHLGNWERMTHMIVSRGHQLSVVIRDADQAGVNALVNELRSRAGAKVIPRGNAARPILERLKAGELVGILPDQNAQDHFMPFFGRMAGTVLGPGVIYERTKSPVLPVTCVWAGPGRYVLTFYPPLEPIPPEGVKGEGMMRAIHTWLESVIRETPEQWLWMHDRWRSARKRGLS